MITDEERREVARRLRSLAGGYVTIGEMEDALGICMSSPTVDLERDARDLHRLADLIEPELERTYHPERIGTAYRSALMCSACKYPLDEVTIYCPHCGARLDGVGR